MYEKSEPFDFYIIFRKQFRGTLKYLWFLECSNSTFVFIFLLVFYNIFSYIRHCLQKHPVTFNVVHKEFLHFSLLLFVIKMANLIFRMTYSVDCFVGTTHNKEFYSFFVVFNKHFEIFFLIIL